MIWQTCRGMRSRFCSYFCYWLGIGSPCFCFHFCFSLFLQVFVHFGVDEGMVYYLISLLAWIRLYLYLSSSFLGLRCWMSSVCMLAWHGAGWGWDVMGYLIRIIFSRGELDYL
jgi:hypothetical protein